MRYFSLREHQICNLAGTKFENLTPRNRKKVEILSNVFFGKNNYQYYDGLLEDVSEVIAPLGLKITDGEEIGNTICYQILPNSSEPVVEIQTNILPTQEQMCEFLAECMKMDYDFIASWPETMIQAAFDRWTKEVNSRNAAKSNIRPLTGHLLVDSAKQFAVCKITTDTRQNVVMAFNKFCESILNPETAEPEEADEVSETNS